MVVTLLVIIDYLDTVCVPVGLGEANSVLIVYTNAVLPDAVGLECFQHVSGRYAQILQRRSGVKISQLATRRTFEVTNLRTRLPSNSFCVSLLAKVFIMH